MARQFLLERVDDAAVVQVYADGFTTLSLRDKLLAWHLYLAAIAGRDIYYDQRYPHSLAMRGILEAILHHQCAPPVVLAEIRQYTKLFWINSGPHNNMTARKFVPRLDRNQLRDAMRAAAQAGARLPMAAGESLEQCVDRFLPLFLDPTVDPTVTCKTPVDGQDMLQASANNLYAEVTMADLAGFDERHPLNSRLVKRDGALVEEVYRVGGRYDPYIRAIVRHLSDAAAFAPAHTADALRALVRFYETGEDADRVAYDTAWVRDQSAIVDTINGFVEVYMDPRGTKGAWEALVYYVDPEKTRRIEAIAAHAQWFEDYMPWDPRFRKPDVRGVTARAIDVVIETGDSGPLTPIGINLPNDQVIRERHGSKSVSLSNIAEAYEQATPEGMRLEFCWDAAEVARAARWGAFSQELTTQMHEVIGHGSGRMAEGVDTPLHLLLGEQYSALEEARADLVALYFVADPKLVELGLLTADDQPDIVRAEYEHYARTALVQLRRVREGNQLEEDHMRNRQMIVDWLRAHTSAIDVRHRDGKTFYVLADAAAFRAGVARLLADVQRIKGEGDYPAARALFAEYGITFDPALRDEVVGRVDALDLPSYTAFVMPRLEPVRDPEGRITDVTVAYPLDLETQMLEYASLTALDIEAHEGMATGARA